MVLVIWGLLCNLHYYTSKSRNTQLQYRAKFYQFVVEILYKLTCQSVLVSKNAKFILTISPLFSPLSLSFFFSRKYYFLVAKYPRQNQFQTFPGPCFCFMNGQKCYLQIRFGLPHPTTSSSKHIQIIRKTRMTTSIKAKN